MPRFATGARPSPRHKLAAAAPHVARVVPASFLVLPKRLSFWGNEEDGDCCSAEEAFAKAAWSLMRGLTETFISEDQVISWAKAHGWLDGAVISDVLDQMQKVGMVAEDGTTYTDGPYHSADWTRDEVLRSAIYTGPVKIGVAAAQLQDVPSIGKDNGWFADGFDRDEDFDHCVCLCGYGTAHDLVKLFADQGVTVAVPSKVAAGDPCYGLFTWKSVGMIARPSLIAVTGEAWVRTPTTVQQPSKS